MVLQFIIISSSSPQGSYERQGPLKFRTADYHTCHDGMASDAQAIVSLRPGKETVSNDPPFLTKNIILVDQYTANSDS